MNSENYVLLLSSLARKIIQTCIRKRCYEPEISFYHNLLGLPFSSKDYFCSAEVLVAHNVPIS